MKCLLADELMKADQLLDLALSSRMAPLIVTRYDLHPFVRFREVTRALLIPNYRGPGRGRARESPYVRDTRDLESKTESGYGSRIANGRPYKDPKGFDRGGKGGP